MAASRTCHCAPCAVESGRFQYLAHTVHRSQGWGRRCQLQPRRPARGHGVKGDGTARIWGAGTGKPVGEPMTHGEAVSSASFSSDGKRIVTASMDKMARVWNTFWLPLVQPENLIVEVCQRKLRGAVRLITEADVRAARILSHDRVGEDVCAGVPAVAAR